MNKLENTFETVYKEWETFKNIWDDAERNDDKEKMAQAKKNWLDIVSKKDKLFITVFNLYYKPAREKGNQMLDIYETRGEEVLKKILKCLKDNGIEKFTYSNSWSSALNDAYNIQALSDYAIVGMTQVITEVADEFVPGKAVGALVFSL